MCVVDDKPGLIFVTGPCPTDQLVRSEPFGRLEFPPFARFERQGFVDDRLVAGQFGVDLSGR